MAEKFVIKREWNDVVIKATIEDGKEVKIECSIEAFENRLCDLLLEELPSLSWDFKSSTINEKVRKSFKEAWAKATKEMKKTTVQVVK